VGERVRYLGVDTSQAQGALDVNRNLVEGQYVELEFDERREDVHGNTLAYVYIRRIVPERVASSFMISRTMVNELLIRAGYARVSTEALNLRYAERLQAAERKAKSERAGLWGKGEIAKALSDYGRRHPVR
jgi:endonuclease YncB( thermonuclease family)